MRGSVVRRVTAYYVKIELDPDPVTGKRRQKWHSGYHTKREAERARIDLLSKFDRGEYVEPTHQTLGEFLVEWLKAIEPTVRLVDVRLVLAEHAQPRDRPHRVDEADEGRRRDAQRPLRDVADIGPAAVVAEGEGLLARRRRARAGAAGRRADPGGDGRAAPRRVRRGVAHHEGHAGVAAAAAGDAGR